MQEEKGTHKKMKRGKSASTSKTTTTTFPVEFHASIAGRRPGFYVLENLAPKYAKNGDDLLFYRLRFTEEQGFPHGNYPFDLQLTRIDNPKSNKRPLPTNEYDEEAFDPSEQIRFQVKFPTILQDKVKRMHVKGANGTDDTFLLLPNYQVHINGNDRVLAIYFVLENNQLDQTQDNVPLWNLGLDESTYWMPRVFGDRYVSVEFVHPDPSVPCDVPSHKQPQRAVRWMSRKSVLPKGPKSTEHQRILGGRIGGTASYKFAGFFKEGGDLNEHQASSAIMKVGRVCEMEVVIAYLAYYTDRIITEVGWFDHPDKPYHGASPDGLVTIPNRTFDDYPGWVTDLFRTSRVNLDNVDPTKMVLEIKVSQVNCEFKAYYVTQLYQEMICTNTYCADLVKMCVSTGEIKVFRVYRNPVFESLFTGCIDRVEKELLTGKRYADVVDHQLNKNLRAECMKVAMYYNGEGYAPTIIPIPAEVEDYRKWKRAFESGTPHPSPSVSKRQKNEEEEAEVVIVESVDKLWNKVRMRTVAINDHLKTGGDTRPILEARLIEEQLEDYASLLKRLRK